MASSRRVSAPRGWPSRRPGEAPSRTAPIRTSAPTSYGASARRHWQVVGMVCARHLEHEAGPGSWARGAVSSAPGSRTPPSSPLGSPPPTALCHKLVRSPCGPPPRLLSSSCLLCWIGASDLAWWWSDSGGRRWWRLASCRSRPNQPSSDGATAADVGHRGWWVQHPSFPR